MSRAEHRDAARRRSRDAAGPRHSLTTALADSAMIAAAEASAEPALLSWPVLAPVIAVEPPAGWLKGILNGLG